MASSNIPLAREHLHKALLVANLPTEARRLINLALPLMHRQKPIRRAPAKYKRINWRLRNRVEKLVNTTNLSYHDIAVATGIHNGARISEIMHGKR